MNQLKGSEQSQIVTGQADVYIVVGSPTGGYNHMPQLGSRNCQPMIIVTSACLCHCTIQCKGLVQFVELLVRELE